MQSQSIKSFINEHSYLLSRYDHIYINRKTFRWGCVNIQEVNPEDVHEVYDLINSMFFYKQAIPFESFGGAQEGHYMFKQLNGTQKEVDLSTLFLRIADMPEITVFSIEYPNVYNIKNKLLILCEKEKFDSLNSEQQEVYITMNAYINLVQRKFQVYNIPEEIHELTEPFHWVWFRKADRRFKKRQMHCVQSWLKLNPSLQFFLWTDMEDESELKDFFADCGPDAYVPFIDGTVNVQYRKQTVQFVKDYFLKYKDDRAIRLFDKSNFTRIIEERDNSEIMIAKTDYLRAMILHDIGGFYADFNDCQCLTPLKYWMKELFKSQEIIWPCDTFSPNDISNYFLYVPKGSKQFERYHYNTIGGFSGLWNFMKNPESKIRLTRIFVDMTRKYINRLKENPTTKKPCKLLVETILPVFGSGKFIADISRIMGKQVLKGLHHTDPRGRIFMSMFPLEFLANKLNDPVLQEFVEYMSAEFMQMGNISLNRNSFVNTEGKTSPGKAPEEGDRYKIQYMNPHNYEDYDDVPRIVPKLDAIIEGLEGLYDDPKMHEFIYYKYRINMCLSIVTLTNIILQNDAKLTLNDVVPFSYAYVSFCYLSLVLHWGDGTSMGATAEDD